ncbi:hypothetical protein JCM8097_007061 [Rhodosporidiobolus ruineniae]
MSDEPNRILHPRHHARWEATRLLQPQLDQLDQLKNEKNKLEEDKKKLENENSVLQASLGRRELELSTLMLAPSPLPPPTSPARRRPASIAPPLLPSTEDQTVALVPRFAGSKGGFEALLFAVDHAGGITYTRKVSRRRQDGLFTTTRRTDVDVGSLLLQDDDIVAAWISPDELERLRRAGDRTIVAPAPTGGARRTPQDQVGACLRALVASPSVSQAAAQQFSNSLRLHGY